MTCGDDSGRPDTAAPGSERPRQVAAAPDSRAATSLLTRTTTVSGLDATWESVRGQTDSRWQWIVALTEDVEEPDWLVRARTEDSRVTVRMVSAEEPGRGLAEAAAEADGEVLIPLAAGDVLSSGAVAALAAGALAEGWSYGDETIRMEGCPLPVVWSKPGSCPEWWRTQPPLVSAAALSRSALTSVGGLRPELRTAAWYDAVLRVSERTAGVHLERVVVGRPDGDVWRGLNAEDAAAAVRSQCERLGVPLADVTPVVVRGWRVGQRLHRQLVKQPSVSVVVPTRGSSSVVGGRSRCHVVELARSLWTASRYAGLEEVVVVHDELTPPDVLQQLADVLGDALVLVPFAEPFNFSRKCNRGALTARGDLLCFLNDDIEIISPEWLEEMVAHLEDPEVAAVGGRLLFADGTLQHIGHQYDLGSAGHPMVGRWADTLALGGAAHVAGERSGVTAACLLVRRGDFQAVGGFSEALPLNYNDVDLCLKLRQKGHRVVYTPHAELYHFESQTRIPRCLSWERDVLEGRWAAALRRDPYLRTEALASFEEPPGNSSGYTTAEQHPEYGRGAA
jgi:hypothetical protein